MRSTFFLATLALALAAAACTPDPERTSDLLSELTLPDGFEIAIYASELPGARSMALGPDGTLYVGSRGEGTVYALHDHDGDMRADSVWTIAEELNSPNGVAVRDGDLYVAEISRILRFDDIGQNLPSPPEPTVVTDNYPTEGHHGWKYIAFGPDGKLYIPVGAPCNICEPEREIYASITRINPDGSGREIVARGVRNSVGFDWHPETNELWFTDNNRDWMGDDLPPGELNRLTETGSHFGYPYLHGRDTRDPEFGEKGETLGIDFTAPAQLLPAHVAPLGLHFYTGRQFPDSYRNRALIAEHGSWNRSDKIGYRISMVRIENGEGISYEPFIEGWLREDDTAWGRPVDLLQLPDGSLLISDDHSGTIYRVTYNTG